MDIPSILNAYYGLLFGSVLLSGLVGFYFSMKFKSTFKGYVSLIISSLVFFSSSVWWFHIASTEAFIGTISWWIFYIGLVVMMYPIYLVVAWFSLRKLNKFISL